MLKAVAEFVLGSGLAKIAVVKFVLGSSLTKIVKQI
jgi:hypothetical protein